MKEPGCELFSDQQTFRERPLLVNPLRPATEACTPSQVGDLTRGVLVAALGPNGLTLTKFDH